MSTWKTSTSQNDLYPDTSDWCSRVIVEDREHGLVIAHVNEDVGANAEANARLIAAAPELLEQASALVSELALNPSMLHGGSITYTGEFANRVRGAAAQLANTIIKVRNAQ